MLVHNHKCKPWSQIYELDCRYIGRYLSCHSKNLIPFAIHDTDSPIMISPLSILHTARGNLIPPSGMMYLRNWPSMSSKSILVAYEICNNHLTDSVSYDSHRIESIRFFRVGIPEYSRSIDCNYLVFFLKVGYYDITIYIFSDVPNSKIQRLTLGVVLDFLEHGAPLWIDCLYGDRPEDRRTRCL